MGQITTLLSQLGVDQTVFVMFGIFTATYLIVSALLTRPMGHLLIERDKRTTGRQEEISKIRVELTEITETLATERRKAQTQASLKFAELRNQAVTEQRKILSDARDEFAGKVRAAREKVEKALVEERQKLDRSSVELKDDLVAKLLGTSSSKNLSLGKEI